VDGGDGGVCSFSKLFSYSLTTMCLDVMPLRRIEWVPMTVTAACESSMPGREIRQQSFVATLSILVPVYRLPTDAEYSTVRSLDVQEKPTLSAHRPPSLYQVQPTSCTGTEYTDT